MTDRDRPQGDADAFAETVGPDALPAARPPAAGAVAIGTSRRPPGDDTQVPSLGELPTLGSSPPGGGGGRGLDDVDLPVVDDASYATADEIARGGMGRIVAATDRRLRRAVAIKELLAVGPEQAQRFRREALITARLQHPAIVPVYEAGRWPSGEPFFAMKLVSGRPLDRVVASARSLAERLALLPNVIAVCEAIAYAHAQRVIHRDLKPANVLVGDFGETVVIDWGLAKDLDADDGLTSDQRGVTTRPGRGRSQDESSQPVRRADADAAADDAAADDRGARSSGAAAGSSGGSTLTVAGAVMGTPAYMPPEQARGDAVDERADVFSLGAMLYHVLAGAPPYQARGATDVIAHAIAGKVLPLRDRARDAPADLIAIVERAMAQDPAGRYPSARELAEELRRFQTGQMVGAHHYSVRERLVRFVRRHRGAVTIAAIALVGFAIGGTIAVRRVVAERDRATAARAVAEQRRAAAEKLVDYMVSDMRDRLDAVGKLALMSGLGENVRDYYHDLAGLPGGMRPEDVDRMAVALGILGDAEQQSGDLDAALATFEDARTRLRALVEADPGSPATARRRAAIGRATVAIGMIHQARGRIDDALASYRDAVALFDDARAAAPADRDLLLGAADAHDRIGDLERNRGAPDEAILDYDQARRFRQDVIDRFGDDDLLARYDLSTSELKLGSAEQNRGASAAAIVHYRACVAGREALAAAEPERVTFRHGLAYAQIVLGDMLRETGALGEARGIYAQALAALDALVQKDPDNTQWRRDRGNVLASLGFVLADLGDARGALDRYAAGLANHAELTARDPDNASWQMDVARLHTRAGDAHLFVGDVAAALASYRAARDIRAALVARDARNPPWRRSLAWSHHKIAGALADTGDVDGALAAAREALALRQALVGESPGSAGLKDELALSEIAIGELRLRTRKVAAAVEILDDATERSRALVTADPENLEWREAMVGALTARAAARLAAGDVAGAAADADDAVARAEATAARLPEGVTWQVLLAEAHWTAAQVARRAHQDAAAHVAAARAVLDALDRDGRLGWEHRALLREVRGG